MQTHEAVKACAPGTSFRMDMGFVHGMKYTHKDEDGRLISSLDGYNSYLLIVYRATCDAWVFLTKLKVPQIENVKKFLEIHGSKQHTRKYIRTDEGGELWCSHAF
jgi:hypothetical protein